MARILVAASSEPRAVVERMLAGHELVGADTLERAEHALRERDLDLIVCTVAFDDSRMFDLLQLAKSMPDRKHVPFVCARVRSEVLRSPAALEGVKFTCRALGAEAFLDIAGFQADPEREMADALRRLLDPPPRREPDETA